MKTFKEYIKDERPYALWVAGENGDEYIYIKTNLETYTLTYIKPYQFDPWTTPKKSGLYSGTEELTYNDLIDFYSSEGNIIKKLSKEEFIKEWTLENI